MNIKSTIQKLKDFRNKMVVEIHEVGTTDVVTTTRYIPEYQRVAEYLRLKDRPDVVFVNSDQHFNKVVAWKR